MKPQRVIEHRQATQPVRCGCGGTVKLVILPSPVPYYNLHIILRCEFYNPPEVGMRREHVLEIHGVLPDEAPIDEAPIDDSRRDNWGAF